MIHFMLGAPVPDQEALDESPYAASNALQRGPSEQVEHPLASGLAPSARLRRMVMQMK
jgi:hypothetical protein